MRMDVTVCVCVPFSSIPCDQMPGTQTLLSKSQSPCRDSAPGSQVEVSLKPAVSP